jgi:hypothetical protein
MSFVIAKKNRAPTFGGARKPKHKKNYRREYYEAFREVACLNSISLN